MTTTLRSETSGPAGGRAARRLIVATLACLSIGACSSTTTGADGAGPGGDDSTQSYGIEGAEADFDRVVAELEWPEGRNPPKKDKSLQSGMNYEVGSGAVDAVMVWNCVWGERYLQDLSTDPGAAPHALDVYASITDRPEFARFYDPQSAQPVVRDLIDQARLGDPSGIAQDQQTNCTDMLTW